MKRKIVSLLLALCMSIGLVSGVSFASEDVSVTTVNGAQIRTTGNQGLRFISTIDRASVDSGRVVEYGMVLIPRADITDISQLKIGATLNGHAVAKVAAKNLYEVTDTKITFTAVLTDIKAKNYTRSYAVRAYAILNDGSVVYTGTGASRSVYEVAKRVLNSTDEINKTFAQEVVDAVDATQYAVVLESKYNALTEDSTVRLGFTDGTSATYCVSKHVDGFSVIDLEKDDPDRLQGFYEGNNLLGEIVEYKIVDGKAQIEVLYEYTTNCVKSSDSGRVESGMLLVGDELYCGNQDSVIFMLYNSGYAKVRFKVYKLEDLDDGIIHSESVNYRDFTNSQRSKTFVKAMLADGNSSDVVLGVMSAGSYGAPDVGFSMDDVGVIVDSVYRYDFDAREEYLELSILSFTEKAIVSGKYYKDYFISSEIGLMTRYDSGTKVTGDALGFAIDAVVNYAHDGFDFIGVQGRATVNDLKSATYWSSGASTFHYATITGTTSKYVAFYPFGSDPNNLIKTMLPVHKYMGMTSIAVVDGEIVGEEIEEVSADDDIDATDYNAIIEILDGCIIKIISLHGNIEA